MTIATTSHVLSDDILQRCYERAPMYDRENRFFDEDFAELRDAGYLLMAVPEEFGGLGMTLAEVCQEQRRLAYYAHATALAVNMHLYWTGLAADLWRAGDTSCEWLLKEAVAGEKHAYAVMLLSRKQPGDREQAISLLDEALGTARELGMRALEERITAQMQHMQTQPDVDPVYPDDLSQREQEVLHLLAVGKSNREIAETLCISLNTVASHVRSILTKTGTTNRTEAAAYAMRHSLRHG